MSRLGYTHNFALFQQWNVAKYMHFTSKSWRKVLMNACNFHWLFLIKLLARCFQITHRTMILPVLKITWKKCHLPYLAWENRVDLCLKNKLSKKLSLKSLVLTLVLVFFSQTLYLILYAEKLPSYFFHNWQWLNWV